jgi:hypothetical protein
MVTNRHGRHTVFFGPVYQVTYANCTIKQAVLGVNMEVNKIGVMHLLKSTFNARDKKGPFAQEYNNNRNLTYNKV